MTMLKTFDLKGNKLSFAEWISNLSPCETPFISMIGKEKVDQTQYSWQVDRLAGAGKENNGAVNQPDAALGEVKEGSAVVVNKINPTVVFTNFTQILRKAVRVSDTTKKVSLYGRGSELGYQLEKAGMEIKRDLESMILNSKDRPRPGTASNHGIAGGVQHLVAPTTEMDGDTGAIVNKVVSYLENAVKFTQVQVFDLTYNLYLAGSKANKVMVHPMNMHVFSDWIGANAVTPHVHRMFDGMDEKYNAHVSTFRDPLGQVFEIIPNRYMPKNQLFFFHESDWTQMILREPTKVELAKNGSAEKHMIEMEVGLRHRNPFASGILEFNQSEKFVLKDTKAIPGAILANNAQESEVTAIVQKADGTAASASELVSFNLQFTEDDGTTKADVNVANVAPTVENSVAKVSTKIKHNKGSRIKVTATVKDPDPVVGVGVTTVDVFEARP
ncbi:MAG: SU10 major capsid protein [Bacteroidales bacterium]